MLFVVFTAGSPPPDVFALNTGVVLTVLAAGVIGICKSAALLGATFDKGVFEKQVTV